ncbi:MAG: murein biosynthesis integral membrane protein MurJ [bacterium]|nr:murein biosynthesis integral membrane protein MurJ [bacterium]
MISKLFTSKINSITVAAVIVAAASLASRFLGIFRDRILASEFGAGSTLDMYYAAFRVPDLIYNLLVLGALSAGFIPVFAALINHRSIIKKITDKENNEAWLVANIALNILGSLLIVTSLVLVIFAEPLTKLLAPGFDADAQLITVNLTRIMFLSPLFLGLSSVFGGVLQSFKRFFVYSLAPIIYNIGIIIGALYFTPIWGVYGLAYGVVFGALMHLLIQVPTVFSLGWRWQPVFNWRNKYIRQIAIMMVPRTLSLAVMQVNLVVITIIASTLAAGSLAVFNFANNLQSFPVGIFGISFAIAAFPTLSALADDRGVLIKNFSKVLRQIIFFILPATVLILTLRAQIIRVILGAGAFDWQDTILTINTLTYFCLSLFAQAIIPLLVRMFYVQKNSKTPFYVGLFAVVVNLGLSLYLPSIIACGAANICQPLGVAGLALAFSISMIINFALLWILLKAEFGNLDEVRILMSTLKISLASIAAGISIQAVKFLIEPLVNMTKFWGVLTQGFLAGSFGIIIFIIVCWLLKSEELLNFIRSIRSKFKREKIETDDVSEARGI